MIACIVIGQYGMLYALLTVSLMMKINPIKYDILPNFIDFSFAICDSMARSGLKRIRIKN